MYTYVQFIPEVQFTFSRRHLLKTTLFLTCPTQIATFVAVVELLQYPFPCSHPGLLRPPHHTAAREQALNVPAPSCPMVSHSTQFSRRSNLNCGVGGDSWESLGQHREQTSQSLRKSTLNIHWKDWCLSWSSNTLATWRKEPTHWKRPWCSERWRARGERDDMTEDKPAGWHHWLNEHGLSKLRETVKDRKAWHAAVHGVTKNNSLLWPSRPFELWQHTYLMHYFTTLSPILAIF